MAVLVNYKDLEVYNLSHELVLDVYHLLKKFPSSEEKNLTSQIQRAVTCLPLNIAEGTGSMSYKGFLCYLYYAYRSSLELEAGLNLAKGLDYLSNKEYDSIMDSFDKFVRKLYRYLQHIESKCTKRVGSSDLPSSYRAKLYERRTFTGGEKV